MILVPILLALPLQAEQLGELPIPDGIAGDGSALGLFFGGVAATLWLLERLVHYRRVGSPESTAEAIAEKVHQELTDQEVAAVSAAVAEQLGDMPELVEELHKWHDREDPDRPGWKIWWVPSKTLNDLKDVATRQSEIDKDLLAALERRAELDRMMMATLETVTRSAANAAAEARAAREAVEQLRAAGGGGP